MVHLNMTWLYFFCFCLVSFIHIHSCGCCCRVCLRFQVLQIKQVDCKVSTKKTFLRKHLVIFSGKCQNHVGHHFWLKGFVPQKNSEITRKSTLPCLIVEERIKFHILDNFHHFIKFYFCTSLAFKNLDKSDQSTLCNLEKHCTLQ